MNETIIGDIKVMCVKALGGPKEGAAQAFNEIESRFSSLKGRKFYGVLHNGEYRACTAIIEGENPEVLGLETMVIPGGKYARIKIEDWEQHTDLIGSSFEKMAGEKEADPTRPRIEFYRSQKELILLFPIK